MFRTEFTLIAVIGFLGLSNGAAAQPESMHQMPLIKETRIYQVTGKEDFDSISGFGDDDGKVGMEYLMMTEGSGMEKMDMETPPTPKR